MITRTEYEAEAKRLRSIDTHHPSLTQLKQQMEASERVVINRRMVREGIDADRWRKDTEAEGW